MHSDTKAANATSSVIDHVTLTVRGFHLDVYGHVNNARYLEFFEEGRWSYMLAQLDLGQLKREGIAMVAVNVNLDWHYPATLHDELVISTSLTHLGNRKLILRQEIHLGEQRLGETHPHAGTLVSRADFTFVLMDTAKGRAISLEGDLADIFRPLLVEHDSGS